MMRQSKQPGALLSWMGSLADPTRLRLLYLLEAHELGVVELCDIVQLPQSTVSRHLKVLADDRWVKSRRQGRIHLYRMPVDDLTSGARHLWQLTREQTADWSALAQDELRLQRRLAERASGTQAFFAGAAGEWDQLRREYYGQSFNDAAMLSLLDPASVIADLGCGTGQLAAMVAPFVKQVIAVDNSPAMLQAAEARTEGLGNVILRKGDLVRLPIHDQVVDAALMVLVMSYLPEPSAVLAEAARILKPGGALIIVDLLAHDDEGFAHRMGQQALGFDPPLVQNLLGARGFARTTVRPLPPEANVKGPVLFIARATR